MLLEDAARRTGGYARPPGRLAGDARSPRETWFPIFDQFMPTSDRTPERHDLIELSIQWLLDDWPHSSSSRQMTAGATTGEWKRCG